jgi:transposase
MKADSEDLRQKIVQAVELGMPTAQTARLFGISLSSVKRYAKLARQGEFLTSRKGSGRPPRADGATKKPLEEDIQRGPAATDSERRRFLESFTGKSLSEHTLRRLLKQRGFSRKKRTDGP